MGASDVTLSPGDILRGIVDHVDVALDACFINVGAHGSVLVPLAGLKATTVARLAPGSPACVQVVSAQHGKKLARASCNIEFSGRTSVLVMDGTAVTGPREEGRADVFVSKRIPSIRRAELATQLQEALADDRSGLPAMLGAVNGEITLILRTASDETPWAQVLSAVVVQVTEAAAFTVLARADGAPALLMAEKPDADGDASIAVSGAAEAVRAEALDGRRLGLDCGGEVVFERTEALWAVAVRPGTAQAEGRGALAPLVNGEAAVAVAETVLEYGVEGVVAVAFMPGMPLDAFDGLSDSMCAVLGDSQTSISGDAALSVVLLEHRGRNI